MEQKYQHSQKGFTLVELSIVLVIIGLIISSVLVGQDLVRAAELRAVVTQYEQFNAAVATFKGKYNGVPGDLRGQTNFGFVGNGNGDTTLGGSTDLTAANATITDETGENVSFWQHLGSSGAALISGTYDGAAVATATIGSTLPKTKVGNYWGVYGSGSTNYFVLGVFGGGAGLYVTSDTLIPLDAKSIDDKIDDGRPGRGIVLARTGHATDASLATSQAEAQKCATAAAGAGPPFAPTAASTYATTLTEVACTLLIRFNL